MSHSLRPQWTLACQAPLFLSPWVYLNPLSGWRYLTISSSAVPFSICPQSSPISGSFPMSQVFVSGDQWPKSRTLTTPNAGKHMEQLEFSDIAWRLQNDIATLEHSVVLIIKLPRLWLYCLAITYFGSHQKELKIYAYTKTCTRVFISIFIHDCQNLKATKISFKMTG